MKKIIAKKDFTSNLGSYITGEEISNLTIEQIKKLNEQGFIEPLTFKDIILIERELKDKNNNKEEL